MDIRRLGLHHAAVANEIVCQNDRTGTRQPQSQIEVLDVARLVGIDEDRVERRSARAFAAPTMDFDSVAEAGPVEILAHDFRPISSTRCAPMRSNRLLIDGFHIIQDAPSGIEAVVMGKLPS